jgi:hypothetical protein
MGFLKSRLVLGIAGLLFLVGLAFATTHQTASLSEVKHTQILNVETTTPISTSEPTTIPNLIKTITSQDAVKIISQQKDVKDWLLLFTGPGQTSSSTTGKPVISYDHMEGKSYVIHVYEDLSDHTSTFNWYKVDRNSGAVTKEF